jgi:hypothetical protein
MRFGIWNAKILNWSGSITTVERELTTYKLDLVGVEEVRWNRGDTLIPGVIIVFTENKKEIINSEQVFCTPQKNISS